MEIKKGLVWVLLQDCGSFHEVLGFTPLILGGLLQIQEEGVATVSVLYLQETVGALVLFLNQLMEEVANILQNHTTAVEIEAQRGVGVGGPQMQADQVVDREGRGKGMMAFHLDEIILTNWRTYGWLTIRR